MTRLAPLRRRLALLRNARAALRWLAAGGSLFAATAGLLLLLLLLDAMIMERSFGDSRWPRILVATILAAALGCFVWNKVRPLLRARESLVEMALLQEHRLGRSSDLVAAVQFDQADARHWGSAQLEQQVIDHAARHARSVRIGPDIPWQLGLRSWGLAALAACAWCVTLAATPDHVSVFLNRLLLGNRHYPTQTKVRRLVVNQRVLPLSAEPGEAAPGAGAARGEEVQFLVECAGKLPDQGKLHLRSARGGEATTLALRPVDDARQANSKGEARSYEATLDRLLEPLVFDVRIGDAWTSPRRLDALARPRVELAWQVTPPAYALPALSDAEAADDAFSRVVLAGSRLALEVRSLGQKPLEAAWLWVSQGETGERISLEPTDDERRVWRSPPDAALLAEVSRELHYELHVRDEHQLTLQTPVRGSFRPRPDRPPFAAASTIHRLVLPHAVPAIAFRLADDFGIGKADLLVEIERGLASGDRKMAGERHALPLPLGELPLTATRLPQEGRFPLDLSSFRLNPGDQLKIELQVRDHRGSAPGESFTAEPLLLEVTDESELIKNVTQADAQADAALTEIIERQLGIEDAP